MLVENINMVKRHTSPNPQAGMQGGIVEKEAPLHLSNVQLWNPAAKKGDRVGIRALADGVACGSSSPTTKSWTLNGRLRDQQKWLRWQGCKRSTARRSCPSS